MQKRKLLPLVAVAFLWCNAFACAQYHNLVVAEHDFKAAVQAFQNAESNEFVAGNIDAATHTKMEQGVLLVASGGQQLNMLLQQNASKQSIIAEIQAINASIQALNAQGVLGVKNQTSQKNLQIILQSVSVILQNIATAIGAPVGTVTPMGGGQ